MKKLSIYARNFANDPSTYYGITKVFDGIDDYNIKKRNIVPNWAFLFFNHNIWKHSLAKFLRFFLLGIITWTRDMCFLLQDLLIFKPDIVFINRDIFPRVMPPVLFCIYKKVLDNSKVIWSFDDYLGPGEKGGEISYKEYVLLLEKAEIISAANDFLRNTIPSKYKSKCPINTGKYTADPDVDRKKVIRARETRKAAYFTKPTLVWLGSSSGLQFLEEIIPYLDNAAMKLKKKTGGQLQLTVVCDKPLKATAKHLIIENVQWTRVGAIDCLYESHIGLMPLPDTPLTRGKSAYKITQYKTAGIPTLASDLEIHRKKLQGGDGIIISRENESEDWTDAVIKMTSNISYWDSLCKKAIKDIDDNFTGIDEARAGWRKTLDRLL